jgi:hypothetical protein
MSKRLTRREFVATGASAAVAASTASASCVTETVHVPHQQDAVAAAPITPPPGSALDPAARDLL